MTDPSLKRSILHFSPFALAMLAATSAAAAPDTPALPQPIADRLLVELLGLFIVAAVMESALSTLFAWRLYREFFSGRAYKTLVMFGFGLAVVKGFDYDVFHRIVVLAGGGGVKGIASTILSALVLAGGSAVVFELFRKLGLRTPFPAPEAAPLPAQGKAWVSVRIVPDQAIGDVRIHIEKVETPTPEQLATPPLAGVLARRGLAERFKAVLSADPLRFPPSGGRTVTADAVYRIVATGRRKANGGEDTEAFAEEIHAGRFADRAVVDLVVTI